jgi:hypothetical protein
MTTKTKTVPVKQTVDIEEFKRQQILVRDQANEIIRTNMAEVKRLLDEVKTWSDVAGLNFDAKEAIADFYGQSWKTSSDYC